MVRTVIADEGLLAYLTKLGSLGTCTVGLILGQPAASKDYVIHFARTPQCQTDNEKNDGPESKSPNKFVDIADAWIADHARHATRMLPGGMYVLGIFVVSKEDIFSPFSQKIKSILEQIHRRLNSNEFLYGNPNTSEKLVLNYCVNTRSYLCKSYDIDTAVIKPAEIKFQPKLAVKWLQVECKYELDQLFSIPQDNSNWSLRKHMQTILVSLNESFKSGVFMFDGEIRDGNDCLELVGKKRKVPRSKSGHHDSPDVKPMQVTIIIPCDGRDLNKSLELSKSSGQIRLGGHIACKLWLHPKASVKEASQAIIQDLVRSLAARLEMHLDSLIEEENGSPEDTNSIHEPPRRVLVSLPDSTVCLSDYLFPGEGPQEAQISLQELLDIQIKDRDAIEEVEGQADLLEFYCDGRGTDVEGDDILNRFPSATNKNIYFAGLVIAFVVLLVSLVIHFVKTFLLI